MRMALYIVALLAVGLLLFAGRNRVVDGVVFQPSGGIDMHPSDIGASGDEVYLEASDGIRIHGFHLTSPGTDRALLFLHGNAGNASHRIPNAAMLARLGIDVLVLDYRGYGMSEGSPSEQGAYTDARAGLDYLEKQKGFRENRILLFGRSMGGGVAVHLAEDRELAGVILESTFTSITDVGRSLLGGLAPLIMGERFPSHDKIGGLRVPLLQFHGDRDEIVPFELGERLFAMAPEPKTFEVIEGAGHNDTIQVGGAAYFARIGKFINEVAPSGARGNQSK